MAAHGEFDQLIADLRRQRSSLDRLDPDLKSELDEILVTLRGLRDRGEKLATTQLERRQRTRRE